MKQLILIAIGASLELASVAAHSQQFPDGAMNPTAGQIKEYLGDKTFKIKLADGNSWRLEYKSNGYFFVNTSTGFNGSGQWQAEDGRLCGHLKGRDRACSDVRLQGGLLYLKRDSGEVIQYASN